MSLFVEYHLIQNFAPSNLNRDDTGAPKDAVFGGHRRARISSQCFKRAVRIWAREYSGLSAQVFSVRTRHLERLLIDQLQSIGLSDPTKFNEIVKLALKKKKGGDDSSSENGNGQEESLLSYLMLISPVEVEAFGEVITGNADTLHTLSAKKKLKASDIPDDLKDAIKGCLAKRRAIDIALFGRMLADLPEANQDAACQVAHALSTHRVEREFDYFTAVDDTGNADETGAGMIGQVEFNSATFYRYAALDANKLLANLQKDQELTLSGLAAFTEAFARAIPSGKQNTFAAHNPPSFIGVVLRHGSPLNLANAFERPVVPRHDQPLTAQSVAALARHEQQLGAVYGDARDCWAVLDLTEAWPQGQGQAVARLGELTAWLQTEVAARLGA